MLQSAFRPLPNCIGRFHRLLLASAVELTATATEDINCVFLWLIEWKTSRTSCFSKSQWGLLDYFPQPILQIDGFVRGENYPGQTERKTICVSDAIVYQDVPKNLLQEKNMYLW